MTKRYFVVEGENDNWILGRLLPKNVLQDTRIIAAGGYSAILSVVQTLFTMTPLPIAIFFDTDTFSDEKIEEKKQFITSYLKNIFANKLLLVPLKPEIESLFFYKKDLLEQIVNRSISNELWQEGKTQPKKVLLELTDRSLSNLKLTSDIIVQLQENPILQDIIKQLSAELTNEQQAAIA
jgi:hypothetical protein